MTWVAVGVGGAALVGGLLSSESSAKTARNQVAPGLGKTAQNQESVAANLWAKESLARYLASMQGMTAEARGTGRGMLAAYQGGAAGLRGMAGRATGETARVYKDYGREAEGVSRQSYADLLANIASGQAIARARSGGVNSGQDMTAAGARAMAMHGLNANLADISGRRAELYGGAIERGRGREIALGQDLLGGEMAARERAFTLPAQYQNAMISTRYNAEQSPTFLYPHHNLQLALGGGSRNPLASDPMGNFGNQLQGVGGYMFGNALDRYMNQPGGGQPAVNNSYANMNGGSNRPR